MSQDPTVPSSAPGGSRRPLLLLAGALILVLAFLGGRVLAPLLRGVDPAARSTTAAPAAETKKPSQPAPAVVSSPPVAPEGSIPASEAGSTGRARARKKAAPVPAPPAASAEPTAGELRIESDVPGAMVFLDRVYLGAAPVTASNVSPGQHQLNVSAEGYDGYSETVQVAAGAANVMVRFKEIRLKETLDVVHKHGIGSCEGRLAADPQGVRYETANKGDAFSLRFADIEVFEVDYLKKNLRVKRRGGKTWNFTTRTENADPLFVFHRNVDKVRQQVAGVAPVKSR